MKNRSAVLAFAVVSVLMSSTVASLAAAPAAQAASTQAIATAIADAKRPQADKDRDPQRHPAEMLAFTGIKPGDKVIEMVPGGGYVTRLIARIVGPTGHIYAANIPTLNERFKTGVNPIVADTSYGNVSVIEMPFGQLKASEPVDVVWTSENYHDMKNPGMFNTDTNAMNKAVFAALKPGGTYLITDYIAAAGSGVRDTQPLHRIDPEVIKSEVTAAGFMLDSQSNVLMNASDNLTARSAQGAAQVFFKFRKPAR